MPVKFIDDTSLEIALSRLAAKTPEIAEKAMRAGADIIADRMSANLREKVSGKLSRDAMGRLIASFGITPLLENSNGYWTMHIGFGGYDITGVPFVLIARSFESGAVRGGRYTGSWRGKKRVMKAKSEIKGKYWRKPTHFASKAVSSERVAALYEIERVAEEEINRIFNGR